MIDQDLMWIFYVFNEMVYLWCWFVVIGDLFIEGIGDFDLVVFGGY